MLESAPRGRLPGLTRNETMDVRPTLAICFPVWNRGDLFEACFSSLLRQLDGVEASIWIFDNGSRAASLSTIERLNTEVQRVFKLYLPDNMGMPYVVNCFCQLVAESCDYAGHRSPEYVMLADADAYFKGPIRDLITILESDGDYAAVSGHDSDEHDTIKTLELPVRGKSIRIKEKGIERGLSLILKTEELRLCYPFPHDSKYNVDWELMQRHPNSLANRRRKVVAVDYVTHLGLYDSTWSPEGVPAGEVEIAEIDSILNELGLLTPERQARIDKYYRLRDGGAVPDPQARAPMQNLILGMHRSGTSVITQLLSLMGCQVGRQEDLLGSNQDNPRGFWERTDVLYLNQQLLGCFGADAYHVGHFEPREVAGERTSELESAGRRILAKFESSRPCVIKDPRLCLVLQFWKRILPAPFCVLIYRCPMEVARSLKTRDGLPLPYGIALWEKYNLAALEHSRGLPRVLVAHRDLMLDPVRTMAYLHRELVALGQDGLQLPDEPTIHGCVAPDLYRQRYDRNDEGEYLNAAQARLLEALRNGDALGWSEVPPPSQQAREILIRYPADVDSQGLSGRQPWRMQLHDQLEDLAGTSHRMEGKLENLERLNGLLERRFESLEGQDLERARQNGELSRRLAAAGERSELRAVELQQIQERSRDELRQAQAVLARKEGELQQVRGQLQDEIRRWSSAVDALEEQRGRTETRLQQTEAALSDRAAAAGALEHRLSEMARTAEEHLAKISRQEGWILELDAVISAILKSRSWKLGNACRELARRLLLRPRQPLAADHRSRIMRRFEKSRDP